MGEWSEKPECFGKISKEKLEDCRQCESLQECMGVTMTIRLGANLDSISSKPSATTTPFDPPYKSAPMPTAEDMARKCKIQYDALYKQGFNKEQSMVLTINLISSFIYR